LMIRHGTRSGQKRSTAGMAAGVRARFKAARAGHQAAIWRPVTTKS